MLQGSAILAASWSPKTRATHLNAVEEEHPKSSEVYTQVLRFENPKLIIFGTFKTGVHFYVPPISTLHLYYNDATRAGADWHY